jgi:hypothetical protein
MNTAIRLGWNLTPQEHDDRACSWADTASRTVTAGHPVTIEGVDWQQACRDHGFGGAIMKVKAAHRLRKANS